MKWFVDILSLGILSFATTRFLIPKCIYCAHKFKILDIPDGVIKHQATVVPYLGGVAVFFGLLCTSIVFIHFSAPLLLFFCASLGLVILGLVDDIAVLSPFKKLVGQCLCTACYLYGGFCLNVLVFPLWFNYAFSFLWILTLINAFNLIDVMDGLAATVAMSASLCFLGVALYGGHYSIAIILTCFLGALAAFLTHNFPPARIYLGDAGSMLLGGVLSSLPLGIYPHSVHGYISYGIVLAIPLIELLTLIGVRTYKGIPFYKGSPDHFSLYLLQNGWTKKNILIYVLGVMFFLSTVSNLFLCRYFTFIHICFFAAIFLMIWTMLIMMPRSFLNKVKF